MLLSCLLAVTFAVCVGVAMYFDANTDVRREVTTDATWEVRHEGPLRVVYLSFPEFPQFAEEAVISERLVEYLKTNNPDSVRVTMTVVYDFDEARIKGPTLTADGINLDE